MHQLFSALLVLLFPVGVAVAQQILVNEVQVVPPYSSIGAICVRGKDPATAPLMIGMTSQPNPDNPARRNDVFHGGYNYAIDGGPLIAGEASIGWALETHWSPGDQNPMFEFYIRYNNNTQTKGGRLVFAQIDKITGEIIGSHVNMPVSFNSLDLRTTYAFIGAGGIQLSDSNAVRHATPGADPLLQAGVPLIKLTATGDVSVSPYARRVVLGAHRGNNDEQYDFAVGPAANKPAMRFDGLNDSRWKASSNGVDFKIVTTICPVMPAAPDDPVCSVGDVASDDTFFYWKSASGWKRIAWQTWTTGSDSGAGRTDANRQP